MGIFKIVSIAISALLIIILLRRLNNDYALLVSCSINIAITVFSLTILIPVFEYIKSLDSNRLVGSLCSIMFKSAGVCLLCSLGGELCRDSGEASLASQIELAGKSTLIAFSLPLIKQVFDYAASFLN